MNRMAILLATALAGCAPHVKPSPAVALPTLTRPVMTLDHPVPWRPTLIEARSETDRSNIIIPSSAISVLGGLPGVFVLDPHRDARFRLIKIGKAMGDRTQILSGLSGRETLVLGDLANVHDGSPIAQENHQ